MNREKRTRSLIGLFIIVCTVSLILFSLNFESLVFEGSYLPYGSRLITHTYLPEKTKYPRVIFLGNSVFQYTPLIEEIRRQRNDLGEMEMFDLANFGAVGASIADYLFLYEYIRQFKPDMVVVHLTPHNFFSREPLMRTDLKRLILSPQFSRLREIPEIIRSFSRNDLAESLIYSYFPPYRFLSILRNEFKNFIYRSGLRIMDFFPWRLNAAEEWRTQNAPAEMKKEYASATEYPESEVLLKRLMERFREDGVSALFVIQERDKPLYPVEQKLKGWANGHENFKVLDLSYFFELSELPDHIHFNGIGAKKSASRILPEIEEMLNSLRSKR
jgi:hypothetical protein